MQAREPYRAVTQSELLAAIFAISKKSLDFGPSTTSTCTMTISNLAALSDELKKTDFDHIPVM